MARQSPYMHPRWLLDHQIWATAHVFKGFRMADLMKASARSCTDYGCMGLLRVVVAGAEVTSAGVLLDCPLQCPPESTQ